VPCGRADRFRRRREETVIQEPAGAHPRIATVWEARSDVSRQHARRPPAVRARSRSRSWLRVSGTRRRTRPAAKGAISVRDVADDLTRRGWTIMVVEPTPSRRDAFRLRPPEMRRSSRTT
jgi:hypothetical protein